MSARRGRDGDEQETGRVHGAWKTPAVVVRRPDGSVVDPGDGRSGDGGRAAGTAGADDRPRRRVRPRRIPGAPGAVLSTPTLTEGGRDAAGRLVRHTGELPSAGPLPPRPPASVTPIRPRPTVRPPLVAGDEAASSALSAGAASSGGGDAAAGADEAGTAGDAASRSRPPLALVGAAIERTGVRRAVQGIDLARLVPDDPEVRAERLARLRRIGVRAAATVVACLTVYTVFPVRTALNLWEAEDRANERKAVFAQENPILEDEIDDLQTDERIEEEARALGMVMPGEESYGIMPAPAAPAPDTSTSTTLPPTTSTTLP